MTPDGSAFIRLTVPKREVYVGESVPLVIEVGMRAGFVTSLNGLPTLAGSDFTLNNLSRQPERDEKTIDGKPFTLADLAQRAGGGQTGHVLRLSVESPLTVRIRTATDRERRCSRISWATRSCSISSAPPFQRTSRSRARRSS